MIRYVTLRLRYRRLARLLDSKAAFRGIPVLDAERERAFFAQLAARRALR
jgi:hypothetical protein